MARIVTGATVFDNSGAGAISDNSLYLSVGGLDTRSFAHMEEIDLGVYEACRRQLWRFRQAAARHLGGVESAGFLNAYGFGLLSGMYYRAYTGFQLLVMVFRLHDCGSSRRGVVPSAGVQ